MDNVKKRVIGVGIGILSTIGIATCFGAAKEKIQESELEKITKSYVTANNNNYGFGNLYIIESNDDINICEIKNIDIANEEEKAILEKFDVQYYDDVNSIPNNIKNKIKYFNKAEQEAISDIEGCFISKDNNGDDLILQDTMSMYYDINSEKLVEPFNLDDVATVEWVLPEYKLLFGDNEFTYDEVKGYAKTYFKK